jgi:hypothetical protein
MEVQLQALLTSAPDGREWSASRAGRFILEERSSLTHWVEGWMGPRAVKVSAGFNYFLIVITARYLGVVKLLLYHNFPES